MAATNHFDIGHLLPGGGGDPQNTYITAQGGQIMYYRDKFLGTQYLKLCQNRDPAALLYGQLVSTPGGNNGVLAVTALDSGSTTSATKAAAFTADQAQGAILWVMAKAATAGAAPEGEMAGIKGNTANTLTLDPKFPLTAALAVTDNIDVDFNYQVKLAATGDQTTTVQGVVYPDGGIPLNQFGWVQFFGNCRALTISAAMVANDILIAGTARLAVVSAGGTDTGRTLIGKNLHIINALSVSDMALVMINCGDNAFGNIGTLDITA